MIRETAKYLYLIVVIWASHAHAQSMQIIGNGGLAINCYRASASASLTGTAGQKDIEECNKAISHGQLMRKDMVATLVNRGVIQAAMQRYDLAAKDYLRAIKIAPKTPQAYLNRGNLWFISNRYQRALSDYDKALELGISQAHIALLNRGMLHEKAGKLEFAKEDYLKALAIRGEWPIAQQKLQRVSAKMK